MGLILDTSVLIAAERGQLELDRLLASVGVSELAIAAITVSELLHGGLRATLPIVGARRRVFIEALLAFTPVAGFGLLEARHHAALWAELAQAGTPVGAHDMIIGATALARGDSVLTLNIRDFRRMAGVVAIHPDDLR